MKILVLLPRVPYPLEKGDKLRAYNHIKFLAKNNEIILCVLNDTDVHPDAIKTLQPFCKSMHIFNISKFSIALNLLKAFFMKIPFQIGYFYNKKAQKEIDCIIAAEKPDHIFCQLVRVAEYLKNQPIPKTIDYQDVFSKGIGRRIEQAPLYLKPVFRSEYKRLLKYEYNVFEIFDNKTIISIPDRDLIPHPEKEKIHIVINGVDTGFFKPIARERDYEIVFIGNMAYPPNVNAAQYLATEILSEVQKSKPNARLLLAGATPDKHVLALQSESVTVSGWMDDIRDGYARAKIFIAPMQIGTGLQNKLLEAMAMKIPSITSPLANSALAAKDGVEILVGQTSEDYAKLIIKLLDNPAEANEIAEAGYQFVLNNYNWESATAVLEEVMKKDR